MKKHLTQLQKQKITLLLNRINLFLIHFKFSNLMQRNKKKLRKTLKQVQKIQKAVNKFIVKTIKNFSTMKKEIKSALLIACVILVAQACNVKRIITNESRYVQRGDTAIVIQTKTTETYDAKKGGTL